MLMNTTDASEQASAFGTLPPNDRLTNSEMDVFGPTAVDGAEGLAFTTLQLKLMGAWASTVLICGTVVNIVTLVALARPANPRIKNPTRSFVMSLTCADLSFCFGVLPFQVSHFLFNVRFEAGVMCTVVPFLRYLTSAAPLMSLMLISMNRYLNIAQRNIYAQVYQDHWIAIMITFTWLTSLTCLVPTVFGLWGKFAYDSRLGACSIVNDDYGRSSKLALFIAGFLVPLVIIVACYACILYMTYRWNQHARKRGLLSKRKEQSQEQRVTIMTATLTVAYIVCYSPLTIAKLIDSAMQRPSLHAIGYCFWYAEAALNPILYVLLNNQYRKEFDRVARKIILCIQWPLARRRGQMNITQADFTQPVGLEATREVTQVT